MSGITQDREGGKTWKISVRTVGPRVPTSCLHLGCTAWRCPDVGIKF